MRPFPIILAVVLAAFASVGGNEYIWPSEVLALPSEVAATGGVVSVRGIVTFMSGLEPNRFVVAPEDHPNLRGVEVVSSVPCEDLTCGAVVLVSGVTTNRNGAVSLDATAVNILRVEKVEPPRVAKQADYRRGLLDGRVVTLEGTVREVRPSDGGRAADMLLLMDGYTATVRIPWGADDDIVGEPVRVTGLARAVFKDGKRVDSLLEVEKAEDIVFRRSRSAWRVLLVAAIVLGGILVCVSAVLLVLWLRIVRARREAEVVAAERQPVRGERHAARGNAGKRQGRDEMPDVAPRERQAGGAQRRPQPQERGNGGADAGRVDCPDGEESRQGRRPHALPSAGAA